ncbi:MAG: efflux transporter outer membrane subunit, partial [Alphaproteobacteria bacterium]|nr:efflux transporter outer membrane subunit [Alphaproteobacteria bacterium]
LAGCAGPRPAAPLDAVVQPPAAWRAVTPAGTAVDAAWWRSFGDPALSQVVETALAHNTDLAVAAARVEEARAQYRLAEAQRLPNLSAGVGGGRQRDVSPFGAPQVQTAGRGQFSVSYDTDLFGRLANASAAARAGLLATEAGRDSLRLAVAATAASGYVNLRALDARLAVLRDTLEARSESRRLTKRRSDTGYSPRLDYEQAEAEYRAAEQLMPVTEAAIARQENGLSVLLGENPRAIVRGRELAQIGAPPVPNGLPADLLRRRPDLAQAEQQLVAADRSLDSARAAFLPNIQLTAAGGYVASTLLNDPIQTYSLGGSLLAPILDGGRLRAQQGVVAARRDQAAQAYRKAALTAFREVEDALAAEQAARAQAVSLEAQRHALSEALLLATNRYKAGYSAYIEKLDAQRSLLAVELTLIQTRSDRLNALIALYQGVGGGWSPQP